MTFQLVHLIVFSPFSIKKGCTLPCFKNQQGKMWSNVLGSYKKWKIIEKPLRQWYLDTIFDMMFTCIILHNTIIKDELDCDLESLFEPHNGV